MPEDGAIEGERLRVVVADDHEPSRVLVRSLLGLVQGVEVVGEAANGYEAVVLAQETEPHLVVLDVNMPRLDGLAAAEALLAANPHIQLIIHTSDPDSRRVRQARRLGIDINDKADIDGLVERLEAAAAKASATPSAQYRLQAAVFAALLGAVPGQSLIVAEPDGRIAFYNQQAAELVGWPFPPQPVPLGEARESVPTFDLSGRCLEAHERPIGRALATRRPVPEEEVVALRDGAFVAVVTGATPLFDERGEFIGVANYFRLSGRDLAGFEPAG